MSQLAREAAESAGGVWVGRRLDVLLGADGAVTVTVTVSCSTPRCAAQLGALVQRIAALQQALEAPPARVDVTIEGIDTEGES